MKLYDKTGREMLAGDLFRVLHFRDRRYGRKRYLYFLLEFHPEFTTKWWGVDVRGGWEVHRFPLTNGFDSESEIVNSLTVVPPLGNYDDFMERPINREILKQRKTEKTNETR